MSMCDVLKIKSFFGKFLSWCFGNLFTIRNDRFQYLPVSSENAVHVAYKSGSLAVTSIIMCVTAPVVAELLIDPAFNRFVAIQAIGLVGGGVGHKFQFVRIMCSSSPPSSEPIKIKV